MGFRPILQQPLTYAERDCGVSRAKGEWCRSRRGREERVRRHVLLSLILILSVILAAA